MEEIEKIGVGWVRLCYRNSSLTWLLIHVYLGPLTDRCKCRDDVLRCGALWCH